MTGANGARQQIERFGKLLLEFLHANRTPSHQPQEGQRPRADCRGDAQPDKARHDHDQEPRDAREHERRKQDGTRCHAPAGLLDQARQPRSRRSRPDQSIQSWKRTFRLAADDRRFARGGGCSRGTSHVLKTSLEPASGEPLGKLGKQLIGPKNEPHSNEEHQRNENHQRTSVTPSNMSAGKWMPEAFSRSLHLGRTPVARNRPITLPSCVTPAFSKRKISCIVMMSPSMPVISLMLVTFLVPSLKRVC